MGYIPGSIREFWKALRAVGEYISRPPPGPVSFGSDARVSCDIFSSFPKWDSTHIVAWFESRGHCLAVKSDGPGGGFMLPLSVPLRVPSVMVWELSRQPSKGVVERNFD